MHSLKAAAHAVGMHPRTLRRWIANGRVEATKARGSNGEAWHLDRDQLDRLRTIAARDIEPVANVMPAAQPLDVDDDAPAPGGGLVTAPAPAPAPALDLAGLVGAVAAAVGVDRQLAQQAAGHAATIAAMRAQLDAERRRADDAADSTAHARALLDDARALVAAQATIIAGLRQQLDGSTRPTTRATQPIDRAALALVAAP